MPAKPVVLIATAGAVVTGLVASGGLLGWTAASPPRAPDPSPTLSPSTVEVSLGPVAQSLGEAPPPHPPAPRLLEGAGPFGAVVNTGTPALALTFDDGPDPTWTPRVLALLRQYAVKATFCLIGTHAQAYPDLVAAIAADGHTLCNHSWNHNTSLGSAGAATIRADLARTTAAIQAAAPGVPVVYYRQPGGFWTAQVTAVARELGLTPLHWAVDPRDWSRPPVSAIVNAVGASPDGAVVLLHDGGGNRANTVEAVTRLLPALAGHRSLEALPTADP